MDKKWLWIGGGAVVAVIAMIGLAMALGGGGGSNGVSGEEATTVSGYLDSYANQYAAGATAVGDDEMARLASGADHDWSVSLEQGQTYRVLGACDTGCSDVDLAVVDAGGNILVSDVLLDDYPVVDFAPSESGRYTVRIHMATCGVETCVAAARLTEVG